MDRGTNADHNRNGLPPAMGAWKWNGWCDGILSAALIAVVFAVTLWLSVVLAHALDIAEKADYASAAMFLPETTERPMRDIEEEQPELPIARDDRGIIGQA